MSNTWKCPHCGAPPDKVKLEVRAMDFSAGPHLHCENCGKIWRPIKMCPA